MRTGKSSLINAMRRAASGSGTGPGGSLAQDITVAPLPGTTLGASRSCIHRPDHVVIASRGATLMHAVCFCFLGLQSRDKAFLWMESITRRSRKPSGLPCRHAEGGGAAPPAVPHVRHARRPAPLPAPRPPQTRGGVLPPCSCEPAILLAGRDGHKAANTCRVKSRVHEAMAFMQSCLWFQTCNNRFHVACAP